MSVPTPSKRRHQLGEVVIPTCSRPPARGQKKNPRGRPGKGTSRVEQKHPRGCPSLAIGLPGLLPSTGEKSPKGGFTCKQKEKSPKPFQQLTLQLEGAADLMPNTRRRKKLPYFSAFPGEN